MKKLQQKGFTLIELLVVIAIIGILAGILFAVIDPADKITDANDAQKQLSVSDLSSAIQTAYADNSYSYENICDIDSITRLEEEYDSVVNLAAGDFLCADSDDAFAVQIALSSGYYCIDSTGFRGKRNNSKGATETVCDDDSVYPGDPSMY